MTEHVTDGKPPVKHPGEPEADVIPLPVHETLSFGGKTHDANGNLMFEHTELWPPLDATLSEDEVASAVEGFNASSVMRGVDNTDRPIALTEWILRSAHVTTDWKDLASHQQDWDELSKKLAVNPKKTLTKREKAIKKYGATTPYEVTKISLGKKVSGDIKGAVDELSNLREKHGSMGLIDFLDGLEAAIGPEIKQSNVIRIYNRLYDVMRTPNSSQPSPELIIAGRILILYMNAQLNPEPKSQP